MLTIGFIGNGKSTNRYQLPYVLTRKNIKVKIIYARNINKKDWGRVEGIIYTDDLNSLLNDPDIQLISICTRHDSHYEYAKMVLEHGKNCLVEKPFMKNSQEAKEIFALAKEKGLLVQCYQNRRYDSDFLTTQKVIESGKLGNLLELEIHFDYYRPEIPLASKEYSCFDSYLYGHGCHTLDQVISYFGKPDKIHYDVRQLLGPGRMNDYFDLDLYYGILKVSIKSSYFRVKERPSFVVYGDKGCFIKANKDRQEEHLKLFYLPGSPGFGIDRIEDYGTLSYYDDGGNYHEEKVVSEVGDYGNVFDGLYETIIEGKEPRVKDEQTLLQMEILEAGVNMCK
ncbi:oxidoreductase [Thomasclavelia cocleata]|uniref:oxidoreductase n=1 Tax=Thomasclavelia cocleata TaxID=69824 RepID=UPI002432C6A5|nr:oxidoreductase [Thomasclavelia cocleata]